MKKNIVLIDYENVQKIDLKSMLNHDVMVKVFHGENQKFTSSFVNTALELGKNKIEFIEIQGTGKNALDFHIAYYIGKISKEMDNFFFHIISRDNGFKPLVDFLNHKENIRCSLDPSMLEMALSKHHLSQTIDEWYKVIKKNLSNPNINKPKRKKTLRNHIMNFCRNAITKDEVNEIIEKLIANKVIQCKNESIQYLSVENAIL
jgi:hypothetical protein